MNNECVELGLSEDEKQVLIDVGVNVLLACAVAGKTYKDVLEWLLTESENLYIEDYSKDLNPYPEEN